MSCASQCLLTHKDEILRTWVTEVRKSLDVAKETSLPVLINTLPIFLDGLAKILTPRDSRATAVAGTNVAEEHGSERARVTSYEAEDIIKEYSVLRTIILRVFQKNGLGDHDTVLKVVRSIDDAIREALTAFFLVHTGLREQVASTLTHDLRSPLTAISSLSQLIKRHNDHPEKVNELADRIIMNSNRMNTMIEDLLDASRMKAGSKKLEFQSCDIGLIARDVISEMTLIYGNRFQIEDTSITGFWNCDSLKRALENLCSNAVKYVAQGTPIHVEIKERFGRMMLSVHNHGPVIPVENRETLFEAFKRSRESDGIQKGWGLGLAFVRAAAEAHGGSVGIVSTEEAATTFILDILKDPRQLDHIQITPGTSDLSEFN